MIDWNEDKFNAMTQAQKDAYIDKILRNNRGDTEYKILTKEQMRNRKKREIDTESNLSHEEKVSATKKGLQIEAKEKM